MIFPSLLKADLIKFIKNFAYCFFFPIVIMGKRSPLWYMKKNAILFFTLRTSGIRIWKKSCVTWTPVFYDSINSGRYVFFFIRGCFYINLYIVISKKKKKIKKINGEEERCICFLYDFLYYRIVEGHRSWDSLLGFFSGICVLLFVFFIHINRKGWPFCLWIDIMWENFIWY